MFKNMKIGVRLIISSAFFLVPMGMMLFFIISGANTSIQSAGREQRGISCLRTVAGLLRITSAGLENAGPETMDAVTSLLRELERGYAAIGGTGAARGEGLIKQINDDFTILRNTGWDREDAAHQRIAGNLRILFVLTGNNAALFMDDSMGDYYLTDAVTRALPRSWERIILIGDLLRLNGDRTGLSGDDSRAAGDYLTLLRDSDYPAIISDIGTALDFLVQEDLSGRDSGAEELFPLLASYRSSVEWFVSAVQQVLSLNPGGGAALSAPSAAFTGAYSNALKAEALAVESSYVILNACLDELGISLQRRVAQQRWHLLRSLGLVIPASILAFAIAILSAVRISRSTGQLRGMFAALEENDLSVTLTGETRDEFGELMTAFDSFLGKLRTAFDSFNENAAMVSSAVFELSSSAREISTTASEQSASVAEILSTMEGNKNLSAQGAAKTQEVAELAARTGELSRRGAELRDTNQEMMGLIQNEHGKIIEEINGLADILARINESIAIIDAIADQTKLIAFNASLEAAASVDLNAEGAGDSARFSVVAAEIRRFADNVVDSTTEIKEQIQELRQASQSLTGEANNGMLQIDQGYDRVVKQKEVFEQIVDVSRNVALRSQQISNVSKQQEYATSQIFIALKEISAGVNQFVTATASTSKIADNLNLMSVELQKILAEYRTGKTSPRAG
ncbi:MAG: methyl-accepting chemotaxis protein [Treponema sp.]|nr:methyl-accepting chemotaxis protein [Treponema sp.]